VLREPFSGLLDAEERHRADPLTFSIPRSDVRRSLSVGSRVKLLFGLGAGQPPSAERMWVEVVAVHGSRYLGRLDNEPVAIADLELGAEVSFGPEHVAAIWRETGDEPTTAQYAIVSSRIWRDGALPQRAYRIATPDPAASGWLLFAADDPAWPPPDLAGFEPVDHAALTDRYRSFDSVEDEPVGTAWRWDEAALEWIADGGRARPPH
jgi:hypothetical protein